MTNRAVLLRSATGSALCLELTKIYTLNNRVPVEAPIDNNNQQLGCPHLFPPRTLMLIFGSNSGYRAERLVPYGRSYGRLEFPCQASRSITAPAIVRLVARRPEHLCIGTIRCLGYLRLLWSGDSWSDRPRTSIPCRARVLIFSLPLRASLQSPHVDRFRKVIIITGGALPQCQSAFFSLPPKSAMQFKSLSVLPIS